MTEAEQAYAEAKAQAVEAIGEVSRREAGSLSDWLPPVLPRDPVELPPPPGHPEPPLALRMAWHVRSIWEGVQELAQAAQEALQRLGVLKERELPYPEPSKSLEAPPRPLEPPSPPKPPAKREDRGIDL
jgi:hypothetical protein